MFEPWAYRTLFSLPMSQSAVVQRVLVIADFRTLFGRKPHVAKTFQLTDDGDIMVGGNNALQAPQQKCNLFHNSILIYFIFNLYSGNSNVNYRNSFIGKAARSTYKTL